MDHSTTTNLLRQLQERSADPARAADCAPQQPCVAPPPASPQQLARAEGLLGFALPEFLRALYLQVANGGFGPGYGLFDLPLAEPGFSDLVGMYWYVCGDKRQPDPDKYFDPTKLAGLPMLPADEEENDDEEPDFVWDWPAHLLPIFSHGCGAYECIDWTQPEGPMVLHDPDYYSAGGNVADTLADLAPSLERRLAAWLAVDDVYERAKKKLAERTG